MLPDKPSASGKQTRPATTVHGISHHPYYRQFRTGDWVAEEPPNQHCPQSGGFAPDRHVVDRFGRSVRDAGHAYYLARGKRAGSDGRALDAFDASTFR